jgi:hypothetical protein
MRLDLSPIRHFLERRVQRGQVRFVSVVVLGMCLALLVVSVWTAEGGRTVFGPDLGGDYAAFYTGGTILNDYRSEQLYDLVLQDRIYHGLMQHALPEEKLPFANPPFIAVLFRPLALLPYAWSYGAWLVISAALYLGGLALLWNTLEHVPRTERSTVLLLALSFHPFIMECWIGGQLSTFGFFWIALALREERSRRPLASGLALGACLYKPTLLVLVLPMLVFARKWRTLLGFTASGLTLAGVSLAAVGWQGCRDFGRLLSGYASATTGSETVFRTWKFVDANSFFKLLFGDRPSLVWLAMAVVGIGALPFLIRAWWGMRGLPSARQMMLWSCTITLSLVLNLYVGIYDTILVVPGMMLTADALYRQQAPRESPPPPLKWLLVLLYVMPWGTQYLARSVGVQPYTLVLAALGTYQFALSRSLPPSTAAPGTLGREATAVGSYPPGTRR